MQKAATIIKRPGIIIATANQFPRPPRIAAMFPTRTAPRPGEQEYPISDADNPVTRRIWIAIMMVSLARHSVECCTALANDNDKLWNNGNTFPPGCIAR